MTVFARAVGIFCPLAILVMVNVTREQYRSAGRVLQDTE
jgi:hypothetical protein